MAAVLPKLSERQNLKIEYFPTPAQCFIFRNYEMLTPGRLARVLGTDEKTVIGMAADMGLTDPATEKTEQRWLDRGYITVIRANWHLLTYAQLCTLLGWDEERLAFILHEDDFLDVKLGRQKPDVPTLAVQELNDAQKKQTEQIFEIVTTASRKIGARRYAPFDFPAVYPAPDTFPAPEGKSRFGASFCCSYCGLYGDTFLDEHLIDASFPDELLRAYAALGIGGVWTQAVLYAMVPCSLDPSLSVGWEKRIRGLNRVIERLKKYGLKLYLYINEPREMSDAFFEKRPDLRGDVQNPGYASLCLSVPEVQDFLRNSIRTLTQMAPGLGGYITITASENHTNCYSHKLSGETTCPRCRSLRRPDLYALTNRLIWEGASSVDPDIMVAAYSWVWDREPNGFEETVKLLPKEVAVLSVSERGVLKKIENVEVAVSDYSISVRGPSDTTVQRLRMAKEHGNRVAAKVQLNNSWELSPLPYIPVFGHFYDSIRGLCEKIDPDVLMMTWTHGGFPSPVLRMVARMTRKGEPFPTLKELMHELFPEADGEKLLSAIRVFDDAFDEFPFSVAVMYNGPQHMGPALPLYPEPTGWTSCMVGLPYDDLDNWANCYQTELFERQFERMSTKWRAGLPLLREAFAGREETPAGRLLLQCAEVTYLHFASSLNHIRYVRARGTGADLSALLREEEEFALREAVLMGENPAIGYEASNHYFFTRTDMLEKVLNCRYLLSHR